MLCLCWHTLSMYFWILHGVKNKTAHGIVPVNLQSSINVTGMSRCPNVCPVVLSRSTCFQKHCCSCEQYYCYDGQDVFCNYSLTWLAWWTAECLLSGWWLCGLNSWLMPMINKPWCWVRRLLVCCGIARRHCHSCCRWKLSIVMRGWCLVPPPSVC